MLKSPIKYTKDHPDLTSDQSQTLSAREGLTCVASMATELQAVAARTGLNLSAMLLGEAAAQARMDLSQMDKAKSALTFQP